MFGQRLTSIIYMVILKLHIIRSPAKGHASDWFRPLTSGQIGLHYLKGSFVDARKEGLQHDAMKNLW